MAAIRSKADIQLILVKGSANDPERTLPIRLATLITSFFAGGLMNISMCYRRVCRQPRILVLAIGCIIPLIAIGQDDPRARDLGIPFAGTPGPYNAITDVAGVTVGHTTLISGDGKLDVGSGPVRTGVTAIHPRGKTYDPVFSGWYALNGNGEMTGTTWVEESGFLEGPVVITNTHSVGVARDATI